MKRPIIYLMIFMLYCTMATPVNAGSNTDVETSSRSSLTMNAGGAAHPIIDRLDPAIVNGLQPVLDSSIRGDESLPSDLKDQRYMILKGTSENRFGIPLHKIQDGRKKSLDHDTIAYKHVPVVDTLSNNPDDRIVPLEYWPWGAEIVSISKVTLEKFEFNIERAKNEALVRGLEASKSAKSASGKKHNGARFCALLHNLRHDTENGGYGIGGTIIAGNVLKSGDNFLAGGGGGSGFGHFKSYIWPDPTYKVIFFDRYVSYDESERNRRSKINVNLIVARRIEKVRCPHVQFDHNSSVVTNDQMVAIECMDEKISAESLGEFDYWALVGGTSEEGTKDYNLPLSSDRAERVNIILARKALDRGEPIEWVQYRIRHHAKGELFPNYKEKEPPSDKTESKNREVYLVKIKDDTLRANNK